MNRRQFLSSVAGLAVSAALPAKKWLGLDLAKPGTNKTVLTLAEYSKRIDTEKQLLFDLLNNTNALMQDMTWIAPPRLDSRREPWHDPKAGDVPVQE